MDRRPLDAHPRALRFFEHAFLIAAVSLAAMYPMSVQAQSLSISLFGKTTASGATPTAGLAADFKRASRFTLTEPATVEQFCVYLDGNGGATGLQQVQYSLYADANGVPGKKVLDISSDGVFDGEAARWRCRHSVALLAIPAGQYWIAIHSSGPAGVIRAYSAGSVQNTYGNADAFGDGSADSFGSGQLATGTLAAYVRYYPNSALHSAGRTTIGTMASDGMTPNFKRVSRFVMPESGKIWSFTTYVDGRGSNSSDDQQFYRYIIYEDSNGVPGDKIWETPDQSVGGTRKPFWSSDRELNFQAPLPTLAAGRYWIGFHSSEVLRRDPTSTATGVIRYFYDHTGNWYSNADPFATAASTPFGAGTAKPDAITAYISYRPGPVTAGRLGRVDVGANPSRALDPDVVRYSYFFLWEDGTLTGLHAYLDGLGGTRGSQDLRMVLYELNITKGEGQEVDQFVKIAESDVVAVPAGMTGRWVDFHVPAVRVGRMTGQFNGEPGQYLIGIHSGPNPVARDYGDNRLSDPENNFPQGNNWGNWPDTFADGASDTDSSFNPPQHAPVTLSVYASYSIP